ncbi:MAG: SCO family protein [Acidobacteria bacterium]|nr:SCO family protein [Acidobacteriota bacterium]
MPVRPDEKPPEIQNVGLDEKLNTQVDPNLTFIDETGQTVALKEYFSKGRPVVLNLVYYSCPMLCGMVLQGVVSSLKKVPYTPGQEIEVVTISFDPKEDATLAASKKTSIMQDYGRPGAEKGWHVLVDKDGNAKKLADQVGFRFKWDDETKQFAHPSVTMILTPEGRMSRYLGGIDYSQRDMRLALAEASQGKIGTISDRFMLYCYKYDPSSRSYVMAATNTMKAGGVLIMLSLGLMLFFFWRREFRGRGGSRNVWEEEASSVEPNIKEQSL